MRIDRELVAHIARLSRLELTEEELDRYRLQLNTILEYFGRLLELPTEGVETTSHPIPVTNVFREDGVTPSLPAEEVLAMAPQTRDGYFVVPRVLEP
ncbi:MAG: Asp-tRNA(Asn)/Glu-tRNA(Gln) amidotransferase subunit GatC [Armatimonadota bacterium]|nr:Asp-tRNA(Asn)/Glu-tRNA(Gln) amidotransferase subunit GatC [Armatimonadota bacterium]MDR7439339.1 Asp-tRNA(Asn)/Glu-tRNA(Gln) amidotransferase subunit GatC [Armatimonadota bacterium]MDR7562029.1 Asp-tRNA(Asn)/Glu-tRNA(Gln) amidotransferase subunit GatC [Armatimonadota bacterium]MDR7566997.1 Asp-tRNA(Asn)/Glu-tRNA(Gln) amidotransferase subunit GatC [Armatimonadota bacterium]MDR7601144.1 Asp-tRNA(Asn)/Glu-tRNA(Gln) amidotransferase subunit GatC [Armatimonadota bacterium]